MTTKSRERAEQLMRLAMDPSASEHEARNAAMQAVRLIAMHGMLREGDKDELARAHREIKSLREHVAILQGFFGGAVTVTRRAPDNRTVIPGVGRLKHEPTWTERISKKFRMLVEATRSSTCKRCGERYEVGDEIRWAKNRGAVHPRCYDAELAESR